MLSVSIVRHGYYQKLMTPERSSCTSTPLNYECICNLLTCLSILRNLILFIVMEMQSPRGTCTICYHPIKDLDSLFREVVTCNTTINGIVNKTLISSKNISKENMEREVITHIEEGYLVVGDCETISYDWV